MSGSVVLLHLAGAIALMLFATRMVRTGVERAYGDVLRYKLRTTMRNLLVWQELVYGVILILAMMFMPRGLWGLARPRRKQARP